MGAPTEGPKQLDLAGLRSVVVWHNRLKYVRRIEVQYHFATSANGSHHKIECDYCDKWFHAACLPDNGGFKRRAKRILDMPEGQEKDDAEWKCMQCKPA